MIRFLRQMAKNLPTLLLAFVLAVAAWVTAVTAADPIETNNYPPIPVEVIGQDPGLVLVSETPHQVILTIKASKTTWSTLNNETGLVHAVVDLAGLGAGTHNVLVQPQSGIHPVDMTATPRYITVTLEKIATQTVDIHLITRGQPATGFQAQDPTLSANSVTISGPESQVAKVHEVRATLDITQAHENITRDITLQPLDTSETVVTGVTVNPAKITVDQPIIQLGGYRDVSVKVTVQGQLVSGYRLTNISVFPPIVTVFSANPQIVNNLPGYVETTPINLDGVKDDFETRVPLNLPDGVTLTGEQNVLVQVGVAAIESSLTLNNMKVEAIGLGTNLAAQVSPETVSLIISGPLPLLDGLNPNDVHIQVDLTGKAQGTYQVAPIVKLPTNELRTESVLPATLEVQVIPGKPTTPTPASAPTAKP